MSAINNGDYKTYLASREWAERREAVRKRSRNKCERCLTAAMQAVHHKTYANVGHEPLEDLQAICNACHEFLSAKTDIDPLTDGWRVYLAGPITNNAWRDSLLLGSESFSRNGPPNSVARGDEWPVAYRELQGGFNFSGPWFEDTFGGHGCGFSNSPSTHACDFTKSDASREHDNACGELGRARVAHACRSAIDACDIVFTWLPKGAAPFGTMFELGYAAAKGKIIVSAVEAMLPDVAPEPTGTEEPDDYSPWGDQNFGTNGDYWLSLEFSHPLLYHSTALDAWADFLRQWPQLRRNHLALGEWRRAEGAR